MPLFSHASLSRVVCEAAVRFAWLMDPGISSEERIMRGAVALFISAEERYKGVRGLPAERFDRSVLRSMHDNCIAERDDVRELIADAGLTFGYSQNDKTKPWLELERCARCYGHDPSAHVRRTRQRREAIDTLMRRAAKSTWAHIATEQPHRGPSSRGKLPTQVRCRPHCRAAG